jgi:hypothetical protein
VRRTSLWLSALVVVMSNAAALGLAWVNRAGTPEAVLELTEREARLLPRDTDRTAMTLRLTWADASGTSDAFRWFDAAKLASLGFDVREPQTIQNASLYRGQAPRAAFAAFEYEGESWQRYLASLPFETDRETVGRGSHLVLVDVGLDPVALRARYPDRRKILITRASVGLAFRTEPGRAPSVRGHLDAVYPIDLTVPPRLQKRLGDVRPFKGDLVGPVRESRGNLLPDAPRYRVRVAWGRALEPWIETID